MAPTVVMHGQLDQSALAALMRDSAVFVLPSFYEGLPLVLVEALACGCRLVCTDLEGVRREIAPYLGAALTLVPMPRLRTVDQPEADDIPAFVDALTTSIARALGQPPLGDPSQTMPEALEHFRWSAVCERIEAVWTRLLQTSA
jgi:glycosyltransferase involved in cell wall biosynthesis